MLLVKSSVQKAADAYFKFAGFTFLIGVLVILFELYAYDRIAKALSLAAILFIPLFFLCITPSPPHHTFLLLLLRLPQPRQ